MSRSRLTRSRPRGEISDEVAWYLKTREFTLPDWCVPAIRTPEPVDVPGAVFDPARVDRVINALRCLRHTQGRWAGKPLEPLPWQVAHVLAPVFGWVAPDDEGDLRRIIRSAYADLPRKSGKTTMSSGLALYLAFADGEPGAQVIAVAGSERQARHCFDPAAQLARSSPELRKGGVRPLQSRIVQQSTASYFEVAASVGDLLHGSNVHGAVIDELHVHKSPDVVDAVESGTGARAQPLIVIITTADEGRPDTVYAAKREFIEKVAAGTIISPSTFGVVFAAGRSDDPFAEATWKTANPGFGVTPTRAFLADEAAKARDNPAQLARFLRLHLGLRTKQESKLIELLVWDRNAGLVDEAKLAGKRCFGGLDLASTSDLTALCWLFPDDAGGFDAVWRFFTPADNLRRLDERTAGAASRWAREGRLTVTPGNVTDYRHVRKTINRDSRAFKVAQIGYDPWNSSQLVTDLQDDGAPMVIVRQGYASLSAPLKELTRLLSEGTPETPMVRHGGNPVMRWMVDNLAVSMDPAGNVKPDRARSSDKIDGVAALVMALSRAMATGRPRRSAYDDDSGGLMIV